MTENNPEHTENQTPQTNDEEPDAEELHMQVADDELDLSALGEPIQTEDKDKESEENQVEYLQQQVLDAKDQMMRAVAETENTRKRMLKERQDAGKYAVSSFARELLEVADNLRRALEAVPDDLVESEPRIKNLQEGIEATERTLLKAFEKNHITALDPTGEIFDPNFHEVMFEAPDTTKPAGTIIQILETGYMLHDRLIRPARVGVVKDEGQGNGAAQKTTTTEPGGNLDQEV